MLEKVIKMTWDDTKTTGNSLTANEWNDMVVDQKVRSYVSSGSGVPSSIPSMVGAIYVDVSNNKIYFAVGTSSSSDWVEQSSGGMSDVVDDATPQLGGDLDLNSKSFTRELTAGESLVLMDVVYLKSDGKCWKADASAEATGAGELLISKDSISADASGTFYESGSRIVTSGLTAGSVYYLSETAGAVTVTKPVTSSAVVRVVGYAESTTVFVFKPSSSWVELS